MRDMKIKFYDGKEKELKHVSSIDFDGETGTLYYQVDDSIEMFVEQQVKEVHY